MIELRIMLADTMLALGYILGYFKVRCVSEIASKLLLYVIIPYLMVHGILSVSSSLIFNTALIITFYLLFSAITLPLLYNRIYSDLRLKASATLSSIIQNVGFIPIPLMTILYNNPLPAIVYSLIFNLGSSLLIPFVGKPSANARELILNILKFPLALTSIIAITLKVSTYYLVGIPTLANPLLTWAAKFMSDASILSFLIIGDVLANIKFNFSKSVIPIVLWRIAISPLIHLIPLLLIKLPKLWFVGVILESLMPPATMNIVYARFYGLREDIVTLSIICTTPISLIASPIIKLLISWNISYGLGRGCYEEHI